MHTSAAFYVLAALLTGAAPAARAESIAPAPLQPAEPAPSVEAAIAIAHDAADRMTVPVMIDGKGPFDFVVDTGADRTTISRELATRLALPPGRPVLLNGSSGARTEQTAVLDTVAVGARQISNVEAPVLSRDWLGADGMLGVDALHDQAVVLDFVAHRMTVQKLQPDAVDPRAIVVNGRNRYGQLILLDAHVNGSPVFVILDSGTQTTVANSTFRRQFADGGSATDGNKPVTVLSVIGGSTPGQFASIPELTLGDLILQNVPVVFSDLYTFSLFHLQNRPAMLLGVNVLRQFDRVSIDYRHRQVSFKLNRSALSWDMAERMAQQSFNR
jgi:predicted aspartyl protease